MFIYVYICLYFVYTKDCSEITELFLIGSNHLVSDIHLDIRHIPMLLSSHKLPETHSCSQLVPLTT